MFRNKSVNVHQFAMVPRADIPRSSFRIQSTHKTTFDAGYLIPIYVDEVLPGDTFNCRVTAFARMSTPIFPLMDNLYLDTFFFFVPNRLVWSNWQKFMGEQEDPGDSISYTVPQINDPTGWTTGSLGDYMGLPINASAGNVHISLPMRAYNLIWNEWFRDQNLQNSATVRKGDSGDLISDYPLRRRGKRHDYFTSALPFLQKGTAVTLPLGSTAPIRTTSPEVFTGVQPAMTWREADGSYPTAGYVGVDGVGQASADNAAFVGARGLYPSNLYADLSAATAATINQLRQSFQIQKLLERDARGGTRYTEIIRAHFGVISPDARLQRPEYLGGGTSAININPIAQTSATGISGGTTPAGTLAAMATTVHNAGFTQAFTEHGYVIGLASVRADLTYQQGMRRMWWRQTRYDYYFPAFAMLGEQAVYNGEIFWGGNATDLEPFGYQERWSEYRYFPSQITGLFRSTATGTIDAWHLAQEFATRPTLNDTFIQENPPMDRILAVGEEALGQQFLFDAFFDIKAARPLPMYSVPGLIDHF